MLARLWWKDARLFWPLWVALGGIAVGAQWLLLQTGMSEARQGILLPIALGWAALYAFAIGASAFAAEREMNTLIFLDTLPVARGALWNHKAAFALVTTLALALALLGLAALGTTERDAIRYSLAMIVLGYGAVVFEAVAWGLFWSVLSSTALLAAVLALATVGLVAVMVSWDVVIAWTPEMLERTATARLVIALGALIASRVGITRRPRPDRLPRVRVARTRHPRPSVGRRLRWETARESRWTWLLMFGGGVALPVVPSYVTTATDPGLFTLFVPFVGLWAGVSVFGPENRGRAYRFLVHHGVKPGKVWGAKVGTWLAVMTILLAASCCSALRAFPALARGEIATWIVVFGANAFVVGLLCGQVLPRSITAWVVGFMALIVVVPPQAGLYEAAMIPGWTLVLPPLTILLVSRLWSDDWMYDLRGAARWRRLAGLLATGGALLFALYVGYRGWSVPAIDLPFDPRAVEPAAVPPGQNAAEDYHQIVADYLDTKWPNGYPQGLDTVRDPARNLNVRTERLIGDVVDQGWDPENRTAVAWWQQNRGLIDRIKRAAAKPVAHFAEPKTLEPETVWDRPGDVTLTRLPSLTLLLALDGRLRQSQGNLAGAWDDILTVFRMAAQLEQTATPQETLVALNLRQQALERALAWAADPKQTPKLLRAALDDWNKLPPLAPLAESLKREYVLMERTLRRVSEDRDALAELFIRSRDRPSHAMRVFLASVLTPPWERERAERVLRLVIANQMGLAALDPWMIGRGNRTYEVGLHWRRGRSEGFTSESTLAWYTAGTPLIRFIGRTAEDEGTAYQEDTLLSRAFEQVVGLRIWQREHGGRYPETLDALVPDILPKLPLDPFSGKPFLWKQADDQSHTSPPLGQSGLFRTWGAKATLPQPNQAGKWLLYSVGPNGQNDGAHHDYSVNPANSDLIFPLPD